MTDQRNDLTPAALAYLGDSVIEVLAREHLVCQRIPDSGKLNLEAAKYVRATSQSAAVENILPLLDETETEVYLRARNAGHSNTPRSATAAEDRRATGMEALFGWLWLGGETGKTRARHLFAVAYDEAE